MIYEALLVFGVIFFSSFIFDVVTQSKHALKLREAREAFLFIVMGCYFVFFWRRSGQTLAMQTWRIKVVDLDGQRLPLIKAIVRYCFAWGWCLPGLVVAHQLGLKETASLIPVGVGFTLWALTAYFERNMQFLHDRLAKTKLIELPAVTKNSN